MLERERADLQKALERERTDAQSAESALRQQSRKELGEALRRVTASHEGAMREQLEAAKAEAEADLQVALSQARRVERRFEPTRRGVSNGRSGHARAGAVAR